MQWIEIWIQFLQCEIVQMVHIPNVKSLLQQSAADDPHCALNLCFFTGTALLENVLDLRDVETF